MSEYPDNNIEHLINSAFEDTNPALIHEMAEKPERIIAINSYLELARTELAKLQEKYNISKANVDTNEEMELRHEISATSLAVAVFEDLHAKGYQYKDEIVSAIDNSIEIARTNYDSNDPMLGRMIDVADKAKQIIQEAEGYTQ